MRILNQSMQRQINWSIQIKWKGKGKENKIKLLWRRNCFSFQIGLVWCYIWKYTSQSDSENMFPLNFFFVSYSLGFRFEQEITQQQFFEAIYIHNHRSVEVGKGLWTWSGSITLIRNGNLLSWLADRKEWILYFLWIEFCLRKKKLNLFSIANENLISRWILQKNHWKNFHYIWGEWIHIQGKVFSKNRIRA